jgi:copper chaperone
MNDVFVGFIFQVLVRHCFITLNVKGMRCNHCVITISGALDKLGATTTIDLASGVVAVQYDQSKLAREAIRAVSEEQGYEITEIR